MLRGGGLCIEAPAASSPDSLTRVSPRIRALQDRLLDSLPADGAWECLSPAQREAIISLHRARLTRNFVRGAISPERGKRQNRKNDATNAKGKTKGLSRYGRSRSYEDKLESETDDSGVRVTSGAGGGTNSSSTTNSQNSHEDDSSDPGVKRVGGRFAKSASADRLARSKDGVVKMISPQPVDNNNLSKRKGVVTNGVGNVNKIISKQLQNRSGPHHSSSNVTLDCRNVQPDRRRARIDTEMSNRRRYSGGVESKMHSKQHEGIVSRKNILQRYQDFSAPTSPIGFKEGVSSEEYDSGVNFRYDVGHSDRALIEEPLKSPRSRGTATGLMNCNFDIELDRFRSDSTTPSPCSPARKDIPGGGKSSHEGHLRSRSRTSILEEEEYIDSSVKVFQNIDGTGRNIDFNYRNVPEPITKKSKKAGYEKKIESNFDYRNHLNQDGILNNYTSNWSSIILSKAVPIIPPARAHPRAQNHPLVKTSAAPHGRSAGNLVVAAASEAHRAGNDIHKKSDVRRKNDDDPRFLRVPHAGSGSGGAKKFARSKSLDRKYLEDEEDSTDEESDFEMRRRNERMQRYAKAASLEWESKKQRFMENNPHGLSPAATAEFLRQNPFPDFLLQGNKRDVITNVPKSKSAWDISVSRNYDHHEVEEIEKHDAHRGSNDNCFRSRKTILNRWKSEDSDLAPDPNRVNLVRDHERFKQRIKCPSSKDLNRTRWRRRSCDFELDSSDREIPGSDVRERGEGRHHRSTTPNPLEIDTTHKQWQRRSCDFEFVLGRHGDINDEFKVGKNLRHEDNWDESLEGERRILHHRQMHRQQPSTRADLGRRQIHHTQDSPRENENKKKKAVEKCYLQEEAPADDSPSPDEIPGLALPMEEYPMQYQIQPEISGRKWARTEDLQLCPALVQAPHPGGKSVKGKGNRGPQGFRGKLKFFKSILSF